MIELKNYPGYFACSDGHIYSTRNGYLRRLPERLHNGYYRVNVRDGNKPVKSHVEPVHKLILEAFVGKRPEGYLCRHLNGNALDNHPNNLCWGTPKENTQDSIRHGTAACLRHGEAAVGAKLTEVEIYKIIDMHNNGHSKKEIASLFFITPHHVGDIINHKTWTHLWTPRAG